MLDGTLNHFKNIVRLLTSSVNYMLGFSNAETIDLLLDDIVMDLLSSSGGDGCMSITFSSLSLFSLESFVGLTCGIDGNLLVWANDSCCP